jgi:hypothetical protein
MSGATDRSEHFAVAGDHLVRSVVPARGIPYEHRCPRAAYETIAHAAELFSTESGNRGFTLEELAEAAGTPSTQAAVALAFMKERGCVVTRYRRNFAAGGCLFEDAMTEYWALAEMGKEEA